MRVNTATPSAKGHEPLCSHCILFQKEGQCYMSKVNAHYERIDPRNGVRNSVPGVDSIVMCIVKVHSQQIDHRNGVSHSVSGVNPFIMRIYFAHVTGVHVSPLLKQLNWPTFDDLITERDVAMIFRAMHHRPAPDALRDTIVYRRDVTARDTRGALTGLLQPPRVRRELARRFFTYRATSAWNRSPSEVRDAVTTRGCRWAVQAWLRGSDER